ncbi:MAG: gliding motility lipoprotein GldH [Paludibacter sp.]
MKNRFLQVIFFLLLLTGCTRNDVYFQYNPIAVNGWSKDTAYVFNIAVSDTAATYNVYVNVRNRGEYPYQNLWLFLKKITPDTIQTKDSIECYLADQRGKWLGSGMGSILEMPVLYQQNVRFNKSGIYRYEIVQGMRDSILIGINDIGMRVEKIK